MCRVAELGFFGDMVVTRLTIPFTWGRFWRAGVREKPLKRWILLREPANFKVDKKTRIRRQKLVKLPLIKT